MKKPAGSSENMEAVEERKEKNTVGPASVPNPEQKVDHDLHMEGDQLNSGNLRYRR